MTDSNGVDLLEEEDQPTPKSKGKKEKEPRKIAPVKNTAQEMFKYYKLSILLFRDMLGPCAEASIWDEHILQRNKKEAKKIASAAKKRITMTVFHYADTDITAQKEMEELRGIIHTYQTLVMPYDMELGTAPIPTEKEEMMQFIKDMEEAIDLAVKQGAAQKQTVFMTIPVNEALEMIAKQGDAQQELVKILTPLKNQYLRDEHGELLRQKDSNEPIPVKWPMISSHMIVGNIKANLKNLINNSPKEKEITSKVSTGEIMAADVKPIEQFMLPTKNLKRNSAGQVEICERPLHFTDRGETKSAIARSQIIPEGAEFYCSLRVRADSPIDRYLREVLLMGKNQGLGPWRGSGNKGAFHFKLEPSTFEACERIPEGWS